MPSRKQNSFGDLVFIMPGIKHGVLKCVLAERLRHQLYGEGVTSSKTGWSVFIAFQKVERYVMSGWIFSHKILKI